MRLRLREQLYRAELESRIVERTAELQKANLRLEKAVTHEHELGILKSNFISMVSHELRNPLCIILSSSQILERYRDRISPEKSAAQFAAIQSAVERITSLTEEVLLFGRFEAGRVALSLAPVDLPSFCTALVDEVLSATHQRCAIALRVEGRFDEAQCDQKLLRHILSNVLQNAVKFSPPAALIDFALRRADDQAIFEIKDRGIGIPTAEQSRLFTTFYRAGNATHLPGTGLGLVIVKRCVDAHGGSISIASAEGIGSLVTIRLPLNQAAAGENEVSEDSASSPLQNSAETPEIRSAAANHP
jgi:signal transduction histidine kinase